MAGGTVTLSCSAGTATQPSIYSPTSIHPSIRPSIRPSIHPSGRFLANVRKCGRFALIATLPCARSRGQFGTSSVSELYGYLVGSLDCSFLGNCGFSIGPTETSSCFWREEQTSSTEGSSPLDPQKVKQQPSEVAAWLGFAEPSCNHR